MPGKFEGEPAYTEYFWKLLLEGVLSGVKDVFEENDVVSYVTIQPEDVELFPSLRDVKYVRIQEDEQGFVRCRPADAIPPEAM